MCSPTVGTRRGEVIAAAARVLARDGLADSTTRKIAAEAGINQAMPRYYFGSKGQEPLAEARGL
jgi:AcrR family transcriptional regulator